MSPRARAHIRERTGTVVRNTEISERLARMGFLNPDVELTADAYYESGCHSRKEGYGGQPASQLVGRPGESNTVIPNPPA